MPRQFADDLGIGGRRGHQPRGLAEAGQIGRLQSHQLDLLDAAGHFLGDLEPRLVRHQTGLADPHQIAADGQKNDDIGAAKAGCRGQRHRGVHHDQQNHQKAHRHRLRQQPHRRDQHPRHQALHFGQHRFAQIGAVAVQEPDIGLAQIAGEQAGADRVVAHLAEAGNRIQRQRLEGEAEDHESKDQPAKKDKKGPVRFKSAEGVKRGQIGIGGHHLGI